MMQPVRNSRLKLSQGRLFWREVGSSYSKGTTLLFLHDAWEDGNAWMPVLEALSAASEPTEYHCIVPDLLGFGESERPRLRYSVELEVECLTEWLEALRLGEIVVVGQGLGGWIAASLALQQPALVRSLILLSPEGVKLREFPGRWNTARLLTMRPPIAGWILKLLAPIARLLKREEIERLLQLRQQWRRSPVAAQLLFNRRARAIRAERLDDRMDWLKLPLLLLLGAGGTSPGENRASALSTAQTRAYAAAPQAQVVEIPGGDDLATLDAGAIAQQIRRFLT